MTLCLPVTGSSTYCERLLPSTRMRWLAGADCPAGRGRCFREAPRPGRPSPAPCCCMARPSPGPLGLAGWAPAGSPGALGVPSPGALPRSAGHQSPRPQAGREELGGGCAQGRPLPGSLLSPWPLGPGAGAGGGLTFVEVPPELMVGAALHHLGDVLRLLVDRHGADGGARGWRGGHFDLDGARLGDLAVQLLQEGRVLQGRGPG